MTTRVLQTAGSIGITITTQENAINMDKALIYCKTGYVIAMDIGYELVMITVKYKYVDSLSGNQIRTPFC